MDDAWTDWQDKRLRKLHRAKLPPEAIAAMMQRSFQSVERRMQALGLADAAKQPLRGQVAADPPPPSRRERKRRREALAAPIVFALVADLAERLDAAVRRAQAERADLEAATDRAEAAARTRAARPKPKARPEAGVLRQAEGEVVRQARDEGAGEAKQPDYRSENVVADRPTRRRTLARRPASTPALPALTAIEADVLRLALRRGPLEPAVLAEGCEIPALAIGKAYGGLARKGYIENVNGVRRVTHLPNGKALPAQSAADLAALKEHYLASKGPTKCPTKKVAPDFDQPGESFL